VSATILAADSAGVLEFYSDSKANITSGSIAGTKTASVTAAGAWSFLIPTTHIFGANSAGNTVVSARTATGDHAVFETRRNNNITTAFGIDDSGSYANATVGSSAFLGTNGETLHFVTGAGFSGSAGNITTGGAWTLGPSGSTATNCAVNGAASVTHGVVFPASQNAVANANTLDDYEEGTFTPTFTASVTNPTNYGQNGRYTKIGNLVHVEIYITFDGTSTFGSGIYAIGGLPFAPAATHVAIGWGLLFKSGSGWYEATMEVPAGGSSGNLIYTQTNSYVTHANPNTWNSGTYFKYQLTYRVA
jgi:hypothetical protein